MKLLLSDTPELLLPLLIAILVVLLFAFLGTKRGAISLAATFSSAILASIAAKPFGVLLLPIASYASIPLLLHTLATTLAAGILVFVVTRICFEILIHILKPDDHIPEGWELLSKLGGALLGGLEGVLVVFIFAWALLTLSEFITLIEDSSSRAPEAQRLLPRKESPFSGSIIPTEFIKKSAKTLRESPLGEITKKSPIIPQEVDDLLEGAQSLIEDPSKIEDILQTEGVSNLLEHPSIQTIINDEEIQLLIRENNIGALLTHEKVNALLNDIDIMEMMTEIDIESLKKILQQK